MSFNPGPIGGNQGNRHFAIPPLQSIDGSEGFLVIVTAAQPIHGFGWVEYRTANGNLRWYSFQDLFITLMASTKCVLLRLVLQPDI